MLAQLFPHPSTVYPASALFGFSAAPLWVAQGEFTNTLALDYAKQYQLDQVASIAWFNGIFFGIFEATQVVGNGISSIVFHVSAKDEQTGDPAKSTVKLLFIVFIALVTAAITLVAFALKRVHRMNGVTQDDEISRDSFTSSFGPVPPSAKRASEEDLSSEEPTLGRLSSQKLLAGTSFAKARVSTCGGKFERFTEAARLMTQPRMASLIPILIANGLARVFIFSDFTELVVKPKLGEDDIGFVMMTFGFTDAVSSFVFGKVSGSSRSTLILLLGTFLHLVCLGFAAYGSFDTFTQVKIYTLCSLWGVADGAWYTMIPAHLGVKFVDEPEAAFSVKTLWEAAAAATLLEVTDLHLETKATAVLGFVLLGTLGFVVSITIIPGCGAGKRSADADVESSNVESVSTTQPIVHDVSSVTNDGLRESISSKDGLHDIQQC